MHRRTHLKFRFQPRHDQLESRRLLSTVYSTNWSGYGAATNLSAPATGSVTAVSGSWVVPTVTAPRRGTYYSSAWVGIDGLSDSTVEQIGTEQDVSRGTAHYDAWWEMYSSGLGQPEQVISGFTIKPGDSITASVNYTGSGNFALKITDSTRNESFTTTQNTNATQSPTAAQSSAEWIVEAPTVGGGQSSLANFGTITFSNASATINPGSGTVTGGINNSAWQNEAIDMITSRGSLLDSTSALNSGGTGFTVTYEGTAGPTPSGGSLGGKALQPRTVRTIAVSLVPPTGQTTAVVFYGVVPTDPVKKDGSRLSGSSSN
jgi:Peptidase A4 family